MEVKHEYSCPNSRPNMSEQRLDKLKIMGYIIRNTRINPRSNEDWLFKETKIAAPVKMT